MDMVEERILNEAKKAWNAGAGLRQRRQRYKRFTYGDQWSDAVRSESGEIVSERESEIRRGRRPMSNNLIRRLVKSIVGRFRMIEEERETGEGVLEEMYRFNNLEELDARALEEFLISGCAIQKVTAESRPGGSGVWVDNISPDKFFVNRMRDPRGCDIELIGELHDYSFMEVVMRYAADNAGAARRLGMIYQQPRMWEGGILSGSGGGFETSEPGRCRVIEVWTLEVEPVRMVHDETEGTLRMINADSMEKIRRENAARKRRGEKELKIVARMKTIWRGRWLAPDGTLLRMEKRERHPYVVKLYPLIDGEVHSLVEDVIDQQIHINRLITLIDFIMGTSAKGALLFPVKQKVEGISWDDISRMWSAADAVIPYAGLPSVAEPHQVTSSGGDGIAKELLQVQLKMFEEVSGVSQALMGKSSGGGNVGIERYEAEVRNATITINDLLKTFGHLREQRDELMIKLSK